MYSHLSLEPARGSTMGPYDWDHRASVRPARSMERFCPAPADGKCPPLPKEARKEREFLAAVRLEVHPQTSITSHPTRQLGEVVRKKYGQRESSQHRWFAVELNVFSLVFGALLGAVVTWGFSHLLM